MKEKKINAYLYILPTCLLMATLVFYPIVHTFIFSVQKLKLTDPSATVFVGFVNYIQILTDADFWYSFQNSVVILFSVVSLALVIGLFIGLLLNIKTKITSFLIAVAIIPWALPPIVNGLLWRWIFHPSNGFMNRLLLNFNVIDEPVMWLAERWSIIFIASFVVAWRNIPFCAIVILSALKAMPKQLYESAKIDGANSAQSFRSISFPLLVPSLGILLTTTSIQAINVFDEIISLSGYGDISKTLMIETYLQTFSFLDFGLGSALVYVIMLFAGFIGIFYVKNVYKEVRYL